MSASISDFVIFFSFRKQEWNQTHSTQWDYWRMQECLAVLAVILTRRELVTSGMILDLKNHQHWYQAVKWVNHGLIIKKCFTAASFWERKMYANLYEKVYTWDFYFYSLRRFSIMVAKDVMEETLRRVTCFQTQFMKDFSWSGKGGEGHFPLLTLHTVQTDDLWRMFS